MNATIEGNILHTNTLVFGKYQHTDIDLNSVIRLESSWSPVIGERVQDNYSVMVNDEDNRTVYFLRVFTNQWIYTLVDFETFNLLIAYFESHGKCVKTPISDRHDYYAVSNNSVTDPQTRKHNAYDSIVGGFIQIDNQFDTNNDNFMRMAHLIQNNPSTFLSLSPEMMHNAIVIMHLSSFRKDFLKIKSKMFDSEHRYDHFVVEQIHRTTDDILESAQRILLTNHPDEQKGLLGDPETARRVAAQLINPKHSHVYKTHKLAEEYLLEFRKTEAIKSISMREMI